MSEVALVNDELIITLSNDEEFNLGNIKGAKGDKGETGAKGDKGEQGIQGVSIIEVTLTAEGELSIKFSNGQVVPLGNIKGQDGADGKDGYTPVKHIDYFTEADKSEMVTSVINALPVYNGEVMTA